jgi:hypothetical protein
MHGAQMDKDMGPSRKIEQDMQVKISISKWVGLAQNMEILPTRYLGQKT